MDSVSLLDATHQAPATISNGIDIKKGHLHSRKGVALSLTLREQRNESCERFDPSEGLPHICANGYGGGDAQSSPLDGVISHFVDSDWPHAFEQLVPLADQGDAAAARIALMMHQHGTRLFAGAFPATAAQRAHWLACSTDSQD